MLLTLTYILLFAAKLWGSSTYTTEQQSYIYYPTNFKKICFSTVAVNSDNDIGSANATLEVYLTDLSRFMVYGHNINGVNGDNNRLIFIAVGS